MDTWMQDVRFGGRMLAKAPAFSAMAVVVLAIGIGATAAMFSLANAVLLRPLPGIGEPNRVVTLGHTHRGADFDNSSYPNYRDLREQNSVFSDVASGNEINASISARGWTERVSGGFVSPNYFRMLNVRMAVGRGFLDGTDDFGGSGASNLVISYSLWQRRFGGKDDAIGKTVMLDGEPVTIVGIAPRGFIGTDATADMEVWLPFGTGQHIDTVFANFDREFHPLTKRNSVWLMIWARLKPGVRLEQADADVQTIAARLRQYPENKQDESGWAVARGVGLSPDDRHNLTQLTAILLSVVWLLLLLACANVANLALARASGRRREIAIRAALGASRARLTRQLLTESLLLSALGGAVGVTISFWAAHAISRLFEQSGQLNVIVDLSPDLHVILLGALVTVTTGVLCGIFPAVQSSRGDVVDSLKEASSTASRRSRLSPVLVAVQLAMCVVLLVGAGLLLRTMGQFKAIPLGFDARNLVLMSVQPSITGKYDAISTHRFYEQLLERVQGIPGVEAATISRLPPVSTVGWGTSIFLSDNPGSQWERRAVSFNTVAPNYFETLGIRILRGRGFNFHDDAAAPPAIVVNEIAAQAFWPGEDPIGKLIKLHGENTSRQVIGVAANMQYRTLLSAPRPYMYAPMWQHILWPESPFILQLRTRVSLAEIAGQVQREVQSLDPALPIFGPMTIEQQIAASYWRQKIMGLLIGIFGIVAVILATVGMYGVMAYAVSERTREVGIRMALGASPRDVLALIISQAVRTTAAGLAAGIICALALAHVIASLLYGVRARDPLTYSAVAMLLGTIAITAGFLPARHAANVAPTVALRQE